MQINLINRKNFIIFNFFNLKNKFLEQKQINHFDLDHQNSFTFVMS